MATATIKQIKVDKTITETQEVVSLEMTRETATVLKMMLGRIGGGGPTRRHVDAVYSALASAGIDYEIDANRFTGYLNIKDSLR
jgi:hypothetical protein